MKAQDILTQAAAHMAKRAEQYDRPEGERSVPAVVEAFNAIKGREALSTADGWLFLTLLKLVRGQTARGDAVKDSVEDAVAYAALMGEQVLEDHEPLKVGHQFVGDPADPAFTVRVGDITMSNEAFMQMMDERRAGSVHRSDTGEAVTQEEMSRRARRAVDELVMRGIAKPERIVTNTGQVLGRVRFKPEPQTCGLCNPGAKCACDPLGKH